jgi:hypothetical protein
MPNFSILHLIFGVKADKEKVKGMIDEILPMIE